VNIVSEKLLMLSEDVNSIVWGPVMVSFFMFIGILFTLKTNAFQVTHLKLWLSETLLAIFRKKDVRKSGDAKSISQFQAASTALAASVGTGNIVGVATAIVLGGPGAIFWMWISAFFGMMTSYAENVLGIKYRYKNGKGEWVGGPMVYMEIGLGCKWLAYIFSVFCVIASLGIGNMSQINSISTALKSTFNIPLTVTGIVFALLVAVVIIGGIKRIAKVAEIVVPFMVFFYMAGAFICLFSNFYAVPAAFRLIFTEAFKMKSAACGVLGYGIGEAIKRGVSRGIFSNEAGLGAAVIAHCETDVKEPATQGMWGMFEVFVDTIVVCTITAIVILSSGVYNMSEYIAGIAKGEGLITGAELSAKAFEATFGFGGGVIVSLCIVLFAFASIIGWSYYGEKCAEYLFGIKANIPYKITFLTSFENLNIGEITSQFSSHLFIALGYLSCHFSVTCSICS
jgi:AGCS family alanine or glycine:cation symporter